MSITKIQIQGGNATPGPPLGPALGGKNLNIRDVVSEINAKTKHKKGEIVRVIININEKSKKYTIQVKNTPASIMLKKAIGIKKGSAIPNRDKVGTISREKLKVIALEKQEDLNAFSLDKAIKILEGTLRSMGVTITN
ncbi:MAG: 50S ribosomal protein L11 [Bacteroidota bacterium]